MARHTADRKAVRTGRGYNIASPLLAFVIWGGWAFYANSGYAFPERVMYGLTQGIVSFTVTSSMIRAVTWLYRRLPPNPLRFILPSVITIVVATVFMVVAHLLAGTPRIAHTIIPGLAVGLAFCLFTTFRISA